MNIRFGLKAMVAIAILASILFAAPTIGRFMPTHKIVEPVYCASCHPEQAVELNATAHLAHFTTAVQDIAYEYKATGASTTTGVKNGISDAEAISGGCQMCHNYWENFKAFGVTNFALDELETDNPAPVTDIYGNDVSPYGLASTKTWVWSVQKQPAGTLTRSGETEGVEPWQAGIDTYDYVDATTGVRHTRLDYVWSALSAVSPGPGAFEVRAEDGEVEEGCGNAEKGLCHAAEQAVGMNAANKKLEVPDQYNVGDGIDGDSTSLGPVDPVTGKAKGVSGNGVFFTHEMAYTTAQYAAKPVKLCGACHVFKLPPMKWGGEPWVGDDIKIASGKTTNADPFGFSPTYDMTGDFKMTRSPGVNGEDYIVKYRTPDWAHQIVPCMRCHVHAGINGESVSTANSDKGRLVADATHPADQS